MEWVPSPKSPTPILVYPVLPSPISRPPHSHIWEMRAWLAGFLSQLSFHSWEGKETLLSFTVLWAGGHRAQQASVCPFENSLSLFSTLVHFYKEEGSSEKPGEGLEAYQETWRVRLHHPFEKAVAVRTYGWLLRLGSRYHDNRDCAPLPASMLSISFWGCLQLGWPCNQLGPTDHQWKYNVSLQGWWS